MSDNKKEERVKTGWVVLEFTKKWGSNNKGDKKTYHISTAQALVDKEKVAKVIEELKKYVPAKVEV